MSKHPDAKWFDERPRRTETCTHCRGHGKVEQPYALVLAEPLAVRGAPNDAIRAFVCGSWDIFTACREAADIAARSGQPVAFEFNGSCVVVRPGADPGIVARRWWINTYNETPEETAARR